MCLYAIGISRQKRKDGTAVDPVTNCAFVFSNESLAVQFSQQKKINGKPYPVWLKQIIEEHGTGAEVIHDPDPLATDFTKSIRLALDLKDEEEPSH